MTNANRNGILSKYVKKAEFRSHLGTQENWTVTRVYIMQKPIPERYQDFLKMMMGVDFVRTLFLEKAYSLRVMRVKVVGKGYAKCADTHPPRSISMEVHNN